MHLLLYCDGSVRRGSRGGIGVVVADGDTGLPIRRFGEPLDTPQSSNTAEYFALLRGLQECLRLGATSVEVYLDSELVRQQVLGNWECNYDHLRALRDRARELLQQFQSWSLERVESRFNPMAHALAAAATEQNRKRFRQHPRKRNEHKTTSTGGETTMILVVTHPELLEADVYPVRLDAVEPVQGNFGEQLRWRFTVTDGKHKGATLSAWSNLSAATNSKTLRWASVLAGEQFAAGDVVNFDQLVGRQARAVVDVRTGGDGRQYNRVTDLLPLRKQQADDDPFLED